MRPANPRHPARAFTLVEMLVVIGIIALLAALLLPAVTASAQRAKRIICVSQLRQLGIAGQSFAHDHNGKFPWQVAARDGGAQEFAQNGYLINGNFHFGFRQFQPLAGYLQTPKILVCPADTRLPAVNFAALQNSNLSYFVGVTADYSQPMSILAGDGNLAAAATLVRVQAGERLTWTETQHRFKGNVLFADDHVEEWSGHQSGGLAVAGDFVLPSIGGGGRQPAGRLDFFNPPAVVSRNAAAPEQPAQAGSVATHSAASPPPTSLPKPDSNAPAGQFGSKEKRKNLPPVIVSQLDISNPDAEIIPVPTNISSGVLSSPMAQEPEMSPFNRKLASFLRYLIGLGYLLWLLLLLLFLAYKMWRWWCQRHR